MAGKIGRIEVFDETLELWDAYKERLDQFFIANSVKDDKKVPALLSLIGGRTYGVLRDLTAPALPAERTYENLCRTLKDHFASRPRIIAERFRFHKRDQHETESIRDFNASLRKLSEFCKFGDTLNDTLRDRIVCGLQNEHIQQRLLAQNDDLTYEQALDIALAMEAATKDASELQKQHSKNLHRMQTKGSNKVQQ